MTDIQAGQRLYSAVCDAEFMVVKCEVQGTLTCGGEALQSEKADAPVAGDAAQKNGSLIGKRYTNDDDTIQLLCVKGGEGSLSLDGAALQIQGAKPLPSSD